MVINKSFLYVFEVFFAKKYQKFKQISTQNLVLRGKTTLLNGDSEADPGHRDTDPESDCLGDRAAALDEQESGTEALYIPECTPDGRFQRVQCYRSTGYCWCVHEDSGKNIPGTSTKDVRPQCDAITPPSRPMKGCPEVKKNAFLKELKEFFKAQIASNGNTGYVLLRIHFKLGKTH